MKKLLLPFALLVGLGIYIASGQNEKMTAPADNATRQSKLSRKLKIYRQKLI